MCECDVCECGVLWAVLWCGWCCGVGGAVVWAVMPWCGRWCGVGYAVVWAVLWCGWWHLGLQVSINYLRSMLHNSETVEEHSAAPYSAAPPTRLHKHTMHPQLPTHSTTQPHQPISLHKPQLNASTPMPGLHSQYRTVQLRLTHCRPSSVSRCQQV